jgi:hypothetical protein
MNHQAHAPQGHPSVIGQARELAEPHPEFPDKSPAEINRPFISMAGIAAASFIFNCRDIQIATNVMQLRGMSR